MKGIIRELFGFIVFIVIVAAVSYFVVAFVGQRTQVSGESMETTLADGDHLIVDKISYRFRDPKRYDIVVFPYRYEENTYYIKRIIGLPGETVQIADGYVYINGVLLDEHYGNEVMNNPGLAAEPITLGADEYFVLGDNRNNSQDSRSANVGVIHRDELLGRAWIRIWPLDKFGVINMNKKSIAQIKEEFEQADAAQRAVLYEVYSSDDRTGVKKLVSAYRKKEEALQKERMRLEDMRSFENKYSTYSLICGIDEAGRGPLAGPVVAGAVILPKDCEILYLNDSKKLSPAKREALYEEIMEKAEAVGVGMASPARIDEINILQATYEAMREAVDNLGVTPELLLNDAVTIPDVSIPQVPIIKGDAKSVSIAAASIIAKVTRDRLMVQYDEILPGYGFARHKGYGSKDHIEAIRRLGPTPIHRQTFIKNFVV